MPAHDAAIQGEEIVRYSFSERLCHWLSGLAYLYCLISGLALFTPYLYWLSALLGGGIAARFWHPWVGLVFFVAMIWMHSLWRRDLRIVDADREWMKNLRYYVTNQDDRVPPQGKFNAGQKQFYWIMFYGTIILLVTGLLMWFPEVFTLRTNWVRQVAIVIHSAAALVTIGAFIIHVYMGLFMVPGGFHAMVSGRVTERWAKSHHPLWYERLTGNPPARP